MSRISPLLLPIIYAAFVSLGLPDGSTGVAWPVMHVDLNLPIGVGGLIVTVATALAAFASFNSGRILARFKMGPVVMYSCLLTGIGLAAVGLANGLPWLLAAVVPLGLGAGAVDVGVNSFVANHYSGRQMTWLHACWGVGAMTGPLLMGFAFETGIGWRGGYWIIAGIQFALAAVFLGTLRHWETAPGQESRATAVESVGPDRRAAADSLAGWLSPLVFAMYVAVEMSTGVWAGSILVVGRGFEPVTAAVCAAAFYAAITGGRILVGFFVDRIGNRRAISGGAFIAFGGALGFALVDTPFLATCSLVVLGFGFAPIYPCLMHEVPRRFVPEAVLTVIGRQSGGAGVGAAVFPAAAGWLAQYSLNGIAWAVAAGIVVLIAGIRILDRITLPRPAR